MGRYLDIIKNAEKSVQYREDGKLDFVGKRPITKVLVGADYTRKCPQCGGVQKLQLRQTEDGVVRDQPYCCRDGGRAAKQRAFEDEGGHL